MAFYSVFQIFFAGGSEGRNFCISTKKLWRHLATIFRKWQCVWKYIYSLQTESAQTASKSTVRCPLFPVLNNAAHWMTLLQWITRYLSMTWARSLLGSTAASAAPPSYSSSSSSSPYESRATSSHQHRHLNNYQQIHSLVMLTRLPTCFICWTVQFQFSKSGNY